eukprot:TRINITY_DN6799_c0_g1_i1.p1 TRINITY_DN6799_c0_g1~~TRINITY_DN6799_c0_g1_i1.p1  ORF type:complete len:963 (+),score=196.82 TRINITY_DN6799_c0_g1_i1:109-2997(+)
MSFFTKFKSQIKSVIPTQSTDRKTIENHHATVIKEDPPDVHRASAPEKPIPSEPTHIQEDVSALSLVPNRNVEAPSESDPSQPPGEAPKLTHVTANRAKGPAHRRAPPSRKPMAERQLNKVEEFTAPPGGFKETPPVVVVQEEKPKPEKSDKPHDKPHDKSHDKSHHDKPDKPIPQPKPKDKSRTKADKSKYKARTSTLIVTTYTSNSSPPPSLSSSTSEAVGGKNVMRIYVENDVIKHVTTTSDFTVRQSLLLLKKKLSHIDTSNWGLFEVQNNKVLRELTNPDDVLAQIMDGWIVSDIYNFVYKFVYKSKVGQVTSPPHVTSTKAPSGHFTIVQGPDGPTSASPAEPVPEPEEYTVVEEYFPDEEEEGDLDEEGFEDFEEEPVEPEPEPPVKLGGPPKRPPPTPTLRPKPSPEPSPSVKAGNPYMTTLPTYIPEADSSEEPSSKPQPQGKLNHNQDESAEEDKVEPAPLGRSSSSDNPNKNSSVSVETKSSAPRTVPKESQGPPQDPLKRTGPPQHAPPNPTRIPPKETLVASLPAKEPAKSSVPPRRSDDPVTRGPPPREEPAIQPPTRPPPSPSRMPKENTVIPAKESPMPNKAPPPNPSRGPASPSPSLPREEGTKLALTPGPIPSHPIKLDPAKVTKETMPGRGSFLNEPSKKTAQPPSPASEAPKRDGKASFEDISKQAALAAKSVKGSAPPNHDPSKRDPKTSREDLSRQASLASKTVTPMSQGGSDSRVREDVKSSVPTKTKESVPPAKVAPIPEEGSDKVSQGPPHKVVGTKGSVPSKRTEGQEPSLPRTEGEGKVPKMVAAPVKEVSPRPKATQPAMEAVPGRSTVPIHRGPPPPDSEKMSHAPGPVPGRAPIKMVPPPAKLTEVKPKESAPPSKQPPQPRAPSRQGTHTSGNPMMSGGPKPESVPPPPCDRCEDKPATKRCQDCDAPFCEDCCAELHKKGKWLSHVLVTL